VSLNSSLPGEVTSVGVEVQRLEPPVFVAGLPQDRLHYNWVDRGPDAVEEGKVEIDGEDNGEVVGFLVRQPSSEGW